MTGPRRWTSEREVLEELERLNEMSMDRAHAYTQLATDAAEAEAAHKALRAKRVLIAKAQGVRSITEAEYTAEADDDVANAYLTRLTTAAISDSCRETLRSIRTNQEALRTAIASLRGPYAGPG